MCRQVCAPACPGRPFGRQIWTRRTHLRNRRLALALPRRPSQTCRIGRSCLRSFSSTASTRHLKNKRSLENSDSFVAFQKYNLTKHSEICSSRGHTRYCFGIGGCCCILSCRFSDNLQHRKHQPPSTPRELYVSQSCPLATLPTLKMRYAN